MEESSQPRISDDHVQYDGKEYRAVKEGLAFILNAPAEDAASKGTKKDLKVDDEAQSVFYNPIQQFNRDLSVLAIKAYGEHVLASRKQRADKRRQKETRDCGANGKKRKRDDPDTEGPTSKEDLPDSGTHAGPSNSPSFTILDALSATGLRALRYASEIPFTTRVVANDLSPSAIEAMKTNIEYNGLGKLIQPNIGDARAYMYNIPHATSMQNNASPSGRFDVIDLDPYGTAAPFMDAAVQGVKDGGLLCVTCTDAAVWASNGYPEKCFALYGGVPSKGSHSHEAGLRLILHGLATSAARYGLSIEPLLSLSIDFYARVFVRVHRSPAEVKFASGNTMLVFNCDSGCGAWSTQPLTQTKQKLDRKGNPFYHYGFAQGPVAGTHCEHCGSKTHVGGPMWAGPLHNPQYIQKILDMLPGANTETYQTLGRLEGMLITALEEDLSLSDSAESLSPEPADANSTDSPQEHPVAIVARMDPALREPHPFYFNLNVLAKVLHTSTVPYDAFCGALRHMGYRTTRSHAKPNTVRTDAPWTIIWEVMREWVRQKSPIKEGALKPGSAGATIMAKSREIPQSADQDQLLDLFKREVLSAAEGGKDISDLVTRVEAALYRLGSRQPQKDSAETTGEVDPRTSPNKAAPVIFDEGLAKKASGRKRLVRYQINPRANWGPLNRASGGGRR
ncbi:putative N2,N2-dimethylguanosine tRNA methyltransferase [Aspergillus steynii IBT 23096]|uniref:tRNA (guanine(26)-N(2))-dimethyltransferase n=1 Tax=Aspergillus steynii IBT 23096 TaxID=1392250 RepID=A0A2I2FVL0_9EURO|nr:putative N2,N2-dimethylguanosine tRNA methyltransferase [Aspergillus steynii IBT 23096]PLB44665.1 putative N2,N2-dimethylguanosine tRNA methyltransferase [Aspergillus steynii IBT 23096]